MDFVLPSLVEARPKKKRENIQNRQEFLIIVHTLDSCYPKMELLLHIYFIELLQ